MVITKTDSDIYSVFTKINMVFQTLNKLKWTKKLENCEIIILHRGAPGDKKTISGKDITEVKKDRFCYRARDEETTIPNHRVLEIKLNGKLIWKRSG